MICGLGCGFGIWNVSSQSGNREVCEELRKMMVDASCLQEVRWRGQGSSMFGMDGGRISCGSLEIELMV